MYLSSLFLNIMYFLTHCRGCCFSFFLLFTFSLSDEIYIILCEKSYLCEHQLKNNNKTWINKKTIHYKSFPYLSRFKPLGFQFFLIQRFKTLNNHFLSRQDIHCTTNTRVVYPALCSLLPETLFQERGLETREEETRERCWYSNHWGAFEERISIAITNKINLPFLLSPSPPFWGLWVPWCWVPEEGRNR